MRCGIMQQKAFCESDYRNSSNLTMPDASHWRMSSSSPYMFGNNNMDFQLQYRMANPLNDRSSQAPNLTLLRDKCNLQNLTLPGHLRELHGLEPPSMTAVKRSDVVDRRRSVDFPIDSKIRLAHNNVADSGQIAGGDNQNNINNNNNNPKYKTEMCRSVFAKVQCKYGDNCQFAHSDDEVRNRPHNTKYKTIDCKNFHQHGYCYYGPKCDFRHNEPLPMQNSFIGDARKSRAASLAYASILDAPSFRQTSADSASLCSLSRAGSDGDSPAPSDSVVASAASNGVTDWSPRSLGPLNADWSVNTSGASDWPNKSMIDLDWSSSTLNVSNLSSVLPRGNGVESSPIMTSSATTHPPPSLPCVNNDWPMMDAPPLRSTLSSRGSVAADGGGSDVTSGEPSPTAKTPGVAGAIGGAFEKWSSSWDVADFFTTVKDRQNSTPMPTTRSVNSLLKVVAKDKQPIFYRYNDGSYQVIYV